MAGLGDLIAARDANSTSQDTGLPLATLPSCAQTCLTAAIPKSSCAPTDQVCLCADGALHQALQTCVRAQCTPRQALATLNGTHTACHFPVRDKSGSYMVICLTLGVLSGVTVALRMLHRVIIQRARPQADDWAIVATFALGVPGTVLDVTGLAANGMGRDVWAVEPWRITAFIRTFFFMTMLYFALMALLKLSLLLFYLRVFPGARVRHLLWATVAFNAIWGAAFVLTAVFQCWPVRHYWEAWTGESAGRCVDMSAVVWANAGVGIALDLWMLAIPLSQLRYLRLHWKKKIGVGLMFCVGTFVTIVSIIRLRSLINFAKTHNPTYDEWDISIWSTIEINVGVMCACMPSLRLMLVWLCPRVFGAGIGSTGGTARRGRYFTQGGRPKGSSGLGRSASRAFVPLNDRGGGNGGGVTPHREREGSEPGGILCSRSFQVDYKPREASMTT